MTLDWKVCSQARLSRDPRFDGKFFIGVRSTKIYCRSICPVPTVKEKNVLYFPTAAAASEAGFRPCLRCRPECSPDTPAWFGTSTTVSRALRLIGESGLAAGGMDGLAIRLGVSPRHLRRLFMRHLGAPPSAVAHTRRLHFAKKLIDETSLSMTNVALASGFGCVRRFNATIRKTYKRTPTQIRCLVRQKSVSVENQYFFQLRFRPPYHWKGMIAFLSAHATPGLEAVNDDSYRRTISVNGCNGYFDVSLDAANNALAVRVQIASPQSLYQIVERIRRMFDLNADWSAIAQSLGADSRLKARILAEPGVRVPGCWDGFELTTHAIISQEITATNATAIAARIAKSFGEPVSAPAGLTHVFPSAKILASAKLTSAGVNKKKAETIRTLARAVCDGKLSFDRIVDSDAFVSCLREIPGINPRTAQHVAMRALGEPDVLPTADKTTIRVLGLHTIRDFEKRSESWRPWRSYASMYLWTAATASRRSSI